MATLEKLVKALEGLKILQLTPQMSDDTALRKKEKIAHCLTIADTMCQSGIKGASNFSHLLTIAIEILLQLCDDTHSDVRMIADESLNRIIRAMADSNIVKIQVELHKEIKKNGNARSLRAALWRFAELCHMIRPQKGKPYVLNLVPCIVQIAKRSEESVLETLAAAMTKIFKALGNFTTDNDIKSLLKAFLHNLSSPSAVVRRTAATSILAICVHCRKPHVFITYVLNILLDCMVPVREGQPVPLVLGALGCLRQILPHVAPTAEAEEQMWGSFGVRRSQREAPPSVDRMIQVYELCLHFSTSPEHNIVVAALETLQQLLQAPPPDLLGVLLSPEGITRSRITHSDTARLAQRSLSEVSMAPSLAGSDDCGLLDPDLSEGPGEGEAVAGGPQLQLAGDEDRPSPTGSPTGSACDEGLLGPGVPLEHCARRLAAAGGLLPTATAPGGRPVRVSGQALALGCLVACVRLAPQLLVPLADVLALAGHTDPQLRGLTCSLAGTALRAVLQADNGDGFDCWRARQPGTAAVGLRELVGVLLQGLSDQSAVCRQSLSVLSGCLPELLESVDSGAAVPLLQALPPLVRNKYWLDKVKLAELLAGLPFTAVHWVTGGGDYQLWALQEAVPALLGDEDGKVRHAAALATVRLVPRLFFPAEQPGREPVTAQAAQLAANSLGGLLGPTGAPAGPLAPTAALNTPPAPLAVLAVPTPLPPADPALEAALGRLVQLLAQALLTSPSRHLMAGCCEALSLLADRYPTTLHAHAWGCRPPGRSAGAGLLSTCLALLTCSSTPLDLSCQAWLVALAGNLFSGLAVWALQLADPGAGEAETSRGLWAVLRDAQLGCAAEQLLVHLTRTLSVFVHVLEETAPAPPAARPTLPAAALSPARRRSGRGGGAAGGSGPAEGTPAGPVPEPPAPDRPRGLSPAKTAAGSDREREERGEERRSAGRAQPTLGSFAGCPHYLRMFEALRSAYTNYKISLDAAASDKFVWLLRATLGTLAQLLELGSLAEAGRAAEELLGYLRLTVLVEPAATVLCVQQLLKCLFGTNLSAQWDEADQQRLQSLAAAAPALGPTDGLFARCVLAPQQRLTETLRAAAVGRADGSEERGGMLGPLRRRLERRGCWSARPSSRGADKASLAAYIRLFEPMVIKALKQYTVTSDVALQCRVLLLLCQLVQLRVNYCLLDSDQIFIGFVLKQFEFIEEGQIPLAEDLLPRIFYFLVHLSYEKNHSRTIISVPKVIQLCDGLMASGQPPTSHCIPALVPVVEDVFLTRGSRGAAGGDLKELDTQREVLLSMLLRLVEYHQVQSLLAAVLTAAAPAERWRRWSRQVADALLPLLAQGRVRLQCRPAQHSLLCLLWALAPAALRPADPLLRVLCAPPPPPALAAAQRWVGGALAALLVLLGPAQGREDALLARLEELAPAPAPLPPHAVAPQDPLGAAAAPVPPPAEQILARALLALVWRAAQQLEEPGARFLEEQLCLVLVCCARLLGPGPGGCPRVAAAAADLVRAPATADLHALLLARAARCPLPALLWGRVLALLGAGGGAFWARALPARPSPCLSLEVLRRGAVVLFADYACGQLEEAALLPLHRLLDGYTEEVVQLAAEPPVQRLVAAANRTEAGSAALLQALARLCPAPLLQHGPGLALRLLRCLRGAHPAQTGALLRLLVPRLVAHPQLAVARPAAALACRCAELLLALGPGPAAQQLPAADAQALLAELRAAGLESRLPALTAALTRLAGVERSPSPSPMPERECALDRAWFLEQAQACCCRPGAPGPAAAQLLSQLDYAEIQAVLSRPAADSRLLTHCLRLGTQLTLQAYQGLSEPPAGCGAEQLVELQQRAAALESPLYVAARCCLLQRVADLQALTPQPHQVLWPGARPATAEETEYAARLCALLADAGTLQQLLAAAEAVSAYLASLPALAWAGAWPPVPPAACHHLARFGVLCLEVAHWLVAQPQQPSSGPGPAPQHLEQALGCAEAVLREPNLAGEVAALSCASWLAGCAAALTTATRFLLMPHTLPPLEPHGLESALREPAQASAAAACLQVATLVQWLEQTQGQPPALPPAFHTICRSLVVSLARMPLVNWYVLTPADAWAVPGWAPPAGQGPAHTQLPALPTECLLDPDLLQHFIFRVALLGWAGRQQFEELWVALLPALSPAGESEGEAGPQTSPQAAVLAVRALTALLLHTLLLPLPGRPGAARLLHQPRLPAPTRSTVRMLGGAAAALPRLQAVHQLLHSRLQEPLQRGGRALPLLAAPQPLLERGNLERLSRPHRYSYGQVSLWYLWTAARMLPDGALQGQTTSACARCLEREQCLAASGLDLHSCLHFLLDLYGQWAAAVTAAQPPGGPLPSPSPSAAAPPPRLLGEALRSLLALSDLFTERAQFAWLLATALDLARALPPEEELLQPLLALAACKAAAVLQPAEVEAGERVRRLLDSCLRCAAPLPARLAGLHGLLYLLQAPAGPLGRAAQASAGEYLQRQLAAPDAGAGEEHSLLLWALAFQLLDCGTGSGALEAALSATAVPTLPWPLLTAVLHGLERLVATGSPAARPADRQRIAQLAADRLRDPNPGRALPALQLLLTCMYTDRAAAADSDGPLTDPEQLILAMEKTSVLFDSWVGSAVWPVLRIRRGYPVEGAALCCVLPGLLTDFFPPSEMLSKVAAEFLSSQQPHPRLLAAVVFQVFERAGQLQLPLLQDWVVCSLPNFTACASPARASWCLSCFFISASPSHWLRALFPHVQARIGRLDQEDRQLLCIAASDFYRHLTDEKQRKTFVSTFEAASGETHSPFAELLASL